ncbi:nitronate monooxygenase (plasmid) [Deinococcus sp. KNUC1210]|uniref:nitronate monooxygenase n=1 Tax=Deinococcus sp. KNUC1210 TaxID=2917691 RepID=UPI001EF07806|nr:nitronate monooxygenase [Deinococcus sp. KNUC1210]ULH13915.1 nitronate monooxygenase [Deinococcus sp. KNUC1210]
MGVGISGWRLARAVSMRGGLGVVSATCLDTLLVRGLQDGDPGGHLRRAMARFPLPDLAQQVERRYYRPQGREAGEPYALLPMHSGLGSAWNRALITLSSFVEVWLARQDHSGPVGINLLTKIQTQTLPSLYGAMLAGVDYVLMGAGIPRDIPGVLDLFSAGRQAHLRLDVSGDAPGQKALLTLDPAEFGQEGRTLRRPAFLPIVSSHLLATMLARRASGSIEGLIVEGPTAGGHNAPPRGEVRHDDQGQPIYGPRDQVDLNVLRELGVPFWLAGGTGSPAGLQQALAQGAAGIQVGTLFAYCQESGLEDTLKSRVLRQAAQGSLGLLTDARASPTGFPFKVVQLADTLSDPDRAAARRRICDLGYLREAYRQVGGGIGFRCPAEPVEAYALKGGRPEDTLGRQCLCNALLSDAGKGQLRASGTELPLLTSGDDLLRLHEFLGDRQQYSAAQVLDWLTTGRAETPSQTL